MDTVSDQAVRPPDTSEQSHPDFSPEAIYRDRSQRFEQLCDVETQRWNRIANIRLFAFLAAAVAIVWGLIAGITVLWVLGLALLALFFGLVRYHNNLGRLRQRYEEL